MTLSPTLAGICAAGYALGSVSFSLLFARWKGVDLRATGSGNPGATNASRAMGKSIGVLVYFLDMAKGFLPAWWAYSRWGVEAATLAGASAFLGHIFPLWSGFRGGKGVATLSGAFFALMPGPTLAAGVVWLLAAKGSGLVAVGSLAFGVALPMAAVFSHQPPPILWFAFLGGPFLFFTHRSNLRRMRAGTED